MPSLAQDAPQIQSQQRVVPCINDSSSEYIPACAALTVLGITISAGTGLITVIVGKPTTDSDKMIVFNKEAPIPPSGAGYVTIDTPCLAYYETADGVPGLDEQWGSEVGSYKLRKGKTGFKTKPVSVGSLPLDDVTIVLQEICRP